MFELERLPTDMELPIPGSPILARVDISAKNVQGFVSCRDLVAAESELQISVLQRVQETSPDVVLGSS